MFKMAFTQAKRRSRHWRTAASMTHWSTGSQTRGLRYKMTISHN